MGKAFVDRVDLSGQIVMFRDLVIPPAVLLSPFQAEVPVHLAVVDPVGHIDPAEPVEISRIPELFRREKRSFHKG